LRRVGSQILKLLVTGAGGFIGSHLSLRLLEDGHDVVGLDNLYSGQERHIQKLELYKNFTFMNHDVVDPFFVEVEGIFNLACPASPVAYQKNPSYTVKTSVLGALNTLEVAKQNKARILQTSTSEVYGDPLISPQKESYFGNVNPVGVRSCYDEGKRVAETLFTNYRDQFNLDTKIVRIFNTYGPNMRPDDGRVVSNFIVQALSSRNLTIYGTGEQTRSLCYIDDMIEGLLLAFFNTYDGLPINLGNPEPIRVIDLANDVIRMTGANVDIDFLPALLDDPKQREPDIARAKSLLKWLPNVPRDLGLERTIQSFQKD
jgi:UDP-glucuronate decarboxylase